MNKKLFIFLFLLIFNFYVIPAEWFLIDQIESIIYGPEETAIITKSDLDRPGLDGSMRTKDKVVFELLVFQDAKRYRVIDDEMVDRYIAAVQSEHNLTLDDLKKMFRDAGYTYVQGREQLSILQTVNSMLDFKIRSKLIISENDVKEYYAANPLYAPEAYQLQRIFIPLAKNSSSTEADLQTNINMADTEMIKKQQEKIVTELNLGKTIPDTEYSDEFLVTKDDLADDKQFISQMKPGEISLPKHIETGFEMFKLVARQEKELISLEMRYKAIADKLRTPLYERLFEEYKKELYAGSVIVDLR